MRDARDVINDWRIARKDQIEHSAQESGQDPAARSRGDLRHQINCNCHQARSFGTIPHGQEEVSSTDPTYRADSGWDGVQIKIRDIKRRIGDIARNMGKKSSYELASINTESPFTNDITRIVISHKFKLP